MKYPRIDKKPMSIAGRIALDAYLGGFRDSIGLDNDSNHLSLSKDDVELLAYNCAAIVAGNVERQARKTQRRRVR